MCHEVKPRTKQQLVDGIKAFWATVDADKCARYIRHSRKVLPPVIGMSLSKPHTSDKLRIVSETVNKR